MGEQGRIPEPPPNLRTGILFRNKVSGFHLNNGGLGPVLESEGGLLGVVITLNFVE